MTKGANKTSSCKPKNFCIETVHACIEVMDCCIGGSVEKSSRKHSCHEGFVTWCIYKTNCPYACKCGNSTINDYWLGTEGTRI